MFHSRAADRAASSIPPNEVSMALLSSVVRAPDAEFADIHIKRDGEPDLLIQQGRLLLTAETAPRGSSPINPNKRWKVFRLYGRKATGGTDRNGRRDVYSRFVVAEEGHSTMLGETVRFSAKVCGSAVEAWEAMGRFDELKEHFADLGIPVVERI